MAKELATVEEVNKQINAELSNEAVVRALLATTFTGLDALSMKKALMDGMIRGFTFKDFREKNVYAIPFGKTYSLVTSIDYSRKLGMRSGIVGKLAPEFEMNGNKIISCSVTVKRKIGEYVGDYTAKVYFDEYDKGSNLWKSKPRTMISKVAEMHALRMACPEALAQQYIEEEIGVGTVENRSSVIGDRLEGAKKDSEGLKVGNVTKNENKNEKENTEQEDNKDEAPNAESADSPIWRKGKK